MVTHGCCVIVNFAMYIKMQMELSNQTLLISISNKNISDPSNKGLFDYIEDLRNCLIKFEKKHGLI